MPAVNETTYVLLFDTDESDHQLAHNELAPRFTETLHSRVAANSKQKAGYDIE
jgi:hypothetical protein